ncbi:hypothetical protein [uncultured Aquimarina sp.]|uniref:hypothetical protein n=1 Tax=uncultured Aquimarina sp. TaxID=575652 RepID=UPI002630B360|nr:hypothetical protein [uncultured Aquimarina sp.]
MNINKLDINKLIKTQKTKSEVIDSLKKFDSKKMEIENDRILVLGKAFYDFNCELNIPDVKLTVKPKKTLLILTLVVLILWTITIIYKNGVLLGLVLTGLFVIFVGVVHKKMIELNLEEISELIKK